MLTLTQAISEQEAQAEEGIERRRGLRIQQTRPIKVFEATASRYFGGQTQDVSATGLRVELPVSASLRPAKSSASTSASAPPATPWPTAAT